MRDYLVAIIVLASMPVGLRSPYYGILVYAWVSYMYPHLLGWSFIRTWPVGKIAGVSALLGAVVNHDGSTRPLKERENLIMILLLLVFCLSTAFAIYPQKAQQELLYMAKIIVVSLLTSTLLNSRSRLRLFFLVVGLSLGFYGVKGGLFGLRTGGEFLVWGPDPSIISGNNAIGLALNMIIPVCWYLAKEVPWKGLKWVLRGTFALTVPAVMFTYSRASTVALGIVLLMLILKSKARIVVLALLVVLLPSAAALFPEKWIGRQESTLEYQDDPSAMSRLGEWEFCWRLAVDRPITGGGFKFFSVEMYRKYLPEFLEDFGGKAWNSHSVYFAILGAHGFPGLLVFLAMIGFSMVSLRKIKRRVRGRQDLQWLGHYADMILVSFVGFLANGAFVNMEYFDLVYHWVGVVASMKVLTRESLASNPPEDVTDKIPEPISVDSGTPVQVHV